MYTLVASSSPITQIFSILLIFAIPIVLAVLGFINWRKGDAEGKRLGHAMFTLAGLVFAVLIAFIAFSYFTGALTFTS